MGYKNMKKLLAIFGALIAAGAAGAPISSVVKKSTGNSNIPDQIEKSTKEQSIKINVNKIFKSVDKKLSNEEQNLRILSQVKAKLSEDQTFKNTDVNIDDLSIIEQSDSQISFTGTKENETTIYNYTFIVSFDLSDSSIDNGDHKFEEHGKLRAELGIVWITNDLKDEDNVRETLENNRLFNMDGLTIARQTSFDSKGGVATYIATGLSGALWEVSAHFELRAHKNNDVPDSPVNYEFANIELGEIDRGPNGTDKDAVENALLRNNKFISLKTEEQSMIYFGEGRAIFSATSFNMGIHHYEITVNFKLVDLDIDNGDDSSEVSTIVMDLGTIFRTTTPDNELIKKVIEGSQVFKEQNVSIKHQVFFAATHAEFLASNNEGHFVKISVSFELHFNEKTNEDPSIPSKDVELAIDLGNIRRDGIKSDNELVDEVLSSNNTIKDLNLGELKATFRSQYQARFTATKLGLEITNYTIDVRYKLLDPASEKDNGNISIPTVAAHLSLGTIYKSPDQSAQEVVENSVKSNSAIKDLGIISFVNISFDENMNSATFVGASIGTTYNITITFDVVDNAFSPNDPISTDTVSVDVNLGEILLGQEQTNEEVVTNAFLNSDEFKNSTISGEPRLTSLNETSATFTAFNIASENKVQVVKFNVTFTISKESPTGDQTSTLNDAFQGHMYGDNQVNATQSGIVVEGNDDESIITAFLQFGGLQDTFKVSDFRIIPAETTNSKTVTSINLNKTFKITTSDTATFTLDAPFNFQVSVKTYELNDLFGTTTNQMDYNISLIDATEILQNQDTIKQWALNLMYQNGGEKVPAGLTIEDFDFVENSNNIMWGTYGFALVAKDGSSVTGRENITLKIETIDIQDVFDVKDGKQFNVELSADEAGNVFSDNTKTLEWAFDILQTKLNGRVPNLTVDQFDIEIYNPANFMQGNASFGFSIKNGVSVMGLQGRVTFNVSWIMPNN